jgi:hypothetical protein
MTRKIKALGLAMFAVLAMSAVVASAAQANANAKFTAPAYPTTAFATDAVKGNQFFGSFGTVFECGHVEFHGILPAASSTLTLNAGYKECTVAKVLPATVNMTSCDYVYHVGQTTGVDQYAGSGSISCTVPGDAIDITIYASHAAHTAGTPICHVTFKAQGPLPGLTLTVNTGPVNNFSISGTLAGMAGNQERKSAFCPAGTEEKAGKYTFKTPVPIKGSNPVGGESRSIDIG